MSLSHYPVRLTELPLREKFGSSLCLTMRGQYFVAREGGLPLHEATVAAMQARGEHWVYIRSTEYDDFLGSFYHEQGFQRDWDRQRYLFERLIPIQPGSLRVGTRPPFHMLTVDADDFPVVLVGTGMREVGDQVLPEHLKMANVFIGVADLDAYIAYLRELDADQKEEEGVLTLLRGTLHRAEAERCVAALFRTDGTADALPAAMEQVEVLQRLILDHPGTYYDLLKVSASPSRVCLHSVNVAVLSMGLAMALGHSEAEMRQVGMAGLFHDIGKRELDPALLHYAELTDEEQRRTLEGHVLLGEEFCIKQEGIGAATGQIVGQHHERLNGSGYPRGLKGDRLDPLGQVLALMEIYDALTLRQPQRRAYRPFVALAKIIQMGGVVNQSIFGRFIRHLGEQTAAPPMPTDL